MLNTGHSERNPWLSLLIIVVLSFGMAIISPTIFSFIISELHSAEYSDVLRAFSQPDLYPDLKVPILTIQFLTSVCSFVLVPLYFISRFEAGAFSTYWQWNNLNLAALLATSLLVIAFMIVNSIFIEWNLNIKFPEGIDELARELEEKGRLLTDYFTYFDSFPYFLYTVVVIAITPAVGEELLFRGVIQKQI